MSERAFLDRYSLLLWNLDGLGLWNLHYSLQLGYFKVYRRFHESI